MQKMKILFVVPLCVALLSGLVGFSDVQSETQSEIERAVSYVAGQTQTAWSSMVLAATGQSNISLSHLQSVPAAQQSATTYAKNILALVANGKNPTTFGSEDYVAKLKSYYQDNQFGDTALLNDDIWAILALSSVGQSSSPQVASAKDYLLANQNTDGGWAYNLTADSDTNDTASAIMALLEAGVSASSQSIQSAITYLKSAQNDDGGFAYGVSQESDSCSDAWGLSLIYKLGQSPTDAGWTKNNQNPLQHMLSLQDTDGGFWWQGLDDNKFCSVYAALALLGKSFPVNTNYNLHNLRIEGSNDTICNTQVSGGTPLGLVAEASEVCGFDYTVINYPGIGLYLSEITGEDSWMYLVDNKSYVLGADSFYLSTGQDVLWYSGDWLNNGWFATQLELTKTTSQAEMQVNLYNPTTSAWENLNKQITIQVGSEEMVTDAFGQLSIGLNAFESGLYQLYIKKQIIDEVGYIRSEKVNLTVGDAPSDHQVGLRVEIEVISAPPGGDQSSISFSVGPDLLDFGKLKPGESSVVELDFVNGQSAVYLQTEVDGDDIFKSNLNIDNGSWQAFLADMAANQQATFDIGLAVPANYNGDIGLRQGSLTFWAVKK